MKVHIQTPPYRFGYELMFFDEVNGEVFIYNPMTKIRKKLLEGTMPDQEDVLYLPDEEVMNNLLQALQKKGAKNPEKSFVEGELQATKYHLADLRKIIKLKP